MEEEKKEIAVGLVDLRKFGCPHCGYKKGDCLIRGEGATLWICRKCKKISHGLISELKETPFTVKTEKGNEPIKREPHPFAI